MNNIVKISIKLFFFLLPLFMLIGYFEYQLRHKPFASSYSVKKNFVEKQLDSVETLVLGSSQTFNGVNPSQFKRKGFNLANVSQTIFYDKRLTLNYLPKLPKLKTVIINISYFSFFYQMFDIKENWRDYYYINHFGIRYKNLDYSTLNNYSFFALYQPIHSLKLAMNKFEDKDAIDIMSNGYQPKYHQELINDSIGKSRVDIHNQESFPKREKEIKEDLDDFVKQLRNRNINVIFITTPVFKTYSKYCNAKVLTNNSKFINELCKKYNCKYLNFFTDNRFIKDDFFDNDHLKNNGANKLSKMISDTLNL
ncbi:MAG: D-alanyl-lipoteichoic acid biosynthesis protein DltD [Chitinophagaceae bacterium]